MDCGLDRRAPPQNPYIPLRGLCNTQERACQSTPVLAANLPDAGTVFCGFRSFQVGKESVRAEITILAAAPHISDWNPKSQMLYSAPVPSCALLRKR